MQTEVLLARVVVHQPDRRVAERRRLEHLADDQLRGVSRAHDEHLLPARDDPARRGAFRDRADEEPRARHENQRQEPVRRGDPARQPDVLDGVDQVDGQVGDEACDRDAADDPPHVPRRDVAPPVVVEAEEEEDDELDPEDDQDRPLEQRLVEDGNAAVEAELEREVPGRGDERRVGKELPDAVSRRNHEVIFAAAALFTASTTQLLDVGGYARPERDRRSSRATARSVSGQRPLLVAEEAQRRLEVERRAVVGRAADLLLLERVDDRVSLGRAGHEQVVDVARLVRRRVDVLADAELAVALGRLTPTARPAVQLPEEEAERCGLDLVQPRVAADEMEVDLVLRPVETEHADALGDLSVGCSHQPAVTEAEQVLRRIEAEGRGCARRDPGRAESLGRVLDERRPDLGELGDRCRAAEEVDGHDRARLLGHARGHVLGIEVERLGVDVREDRRRAAPGDRLGGRVEREGRADDLVAGADSHRLEHEQQRVRPVGDADPVLDAEVVRGLLLEGLDVRAEDEPPVLEDGGDALLQLGQEWLVLRLDVDQRDGHSVRQSRSVAAGFVLRDDHQRQSA